MKTLATITLALAVTLTSLPAHALTIRLPFIGIAVRVPLMVRPHYRYAPRQHVVRSAPRQVAPRSAPKSTVASSGGVSINEPR
jgi:hypothetical protein